MYRVKDGPQFRLVDARASMRSNTWQMAASGALTRGKLAEDVSVYVIRVPAPASLSRTSPP